MRNNLSDSASKYDLISFAGILKILDSTSTIGQY
jgi:hypothetical protein